MIMSNVKKKVVLVTTQRSGSNFLRAVLRGHPEIFFYQEVLLESAWEHDWSIYHYLLERIKENPANITHTNIKRHQRAYFSSIFSRRESESIVGIDIKYDQFPQLPGILEMLIDEGVVVIHLIRRNVLRTLVSEKAQCIA